MTANPCRGRLVALDDNASSAELVARVATQCGYEAQPITDPNALRELLVEWKPEVLTLDLCMPDGDGIALLSILEETKFAGQLILISGQDAWLRAAAGRLAASKGLNVARDLGKPLNLAAFRELLKGLQPAA